MLGVTRQSINELVQRGIIVADAEGRIDVELARMALLNRVNPGSKTAQAVAGQAAPALQPAPAIAPAAADPDLATTSYHVAKTIRESNEAAIAGLKLAEMRDILITVDEVRKKLGARIATSRDALMQIPARLAPVLAAETDQAKVHDLMHAEISGALEHLNTALNSLPTPMEAAT